MQMAKHTYSIWVKLAFFAAASGLAFLFGLISVTANPIFIGLAVGLVAGTFLLAIPKKTIFLVIALGLATPALLDMLGHGFHRVLWAVSMMALLLWIPSLLNLFSFNPQHKKNVPLFIWLAMHLLSAYRSCMAWVNYSADLNVIFKHLAYCWP
jgi:hypothetical protein